MNLANLTLRNAARWARHPMAVLNWIQCMDYHPEGLTPLPPEIERCFPHARRARSFNLHVPHIVRQDSRFPGVGWVTWDEATLLYNYGLRLRGGALLEIGCWVGWSTVALALSGAAVVVIDPALDGAPQGEACRESLRLAGLADSVELVGGYSPDAIAPLASENRNWGAFFIDGEHEGDAPVRDARACAAVAGPDCTILLHDLIRPNIAEALRWLQDAGWRCTVHYTGNFIGVACRGDAAPLAHRPDPRVPWEKLVRKQWSHLVAFPRA